MWSRAQTEIVIFSLNGMFGVLRRSKGANTGQPSAGGAAGAGVRSLAAFHPFHPFHLRQTGESSSEKSSMAEPQTPCCTHVASRFIPPSAVARLMSSGNGPLLAAVVPSPGPVNAAGTPAPTLLAGIFRQEREEGAAQIVSVAQTAISCPAGR